MLIGAVWWERSLERSLERSWNGATSYLDGLRALCLVESGALQMRVVSIRIRRCAWDM